MACEFNYMHTAKWLMKNSAVIAICSCDETIDPIPALRIKRVVCVQENSGLIILVHSIPEPVEQETRRDDGNLMGLLDITKAYEAWEADLVNNADWQNSVPRMTQAQFDRLLEIQAMRNDAVGKAIGAMT